MIFGEIYLAIEKMCIPELIFFPCLYIQSSNLCLFVRSYLMYPWTDLPQILIGELGRTTGMFFDLFKNYKLSGLTFTEKLQSKLGTQAS